MSILFEYIQSMRLIKASIGSTPETSYYGVLETLLNEIGEDLQPKVHAVIQVSQSGVGYPDGGIYERSPGNTHVHRALLEVKPVGDDTLRTASDEQVTKYWNKTPLVLVTNYRDFVIVGQDELSGQSRIEDVFSLVESEEQFWVGPARQIVNQHEAQLIEFLSEFMRRGANITNARDLAEQLAYYARIARERIFSIPGEDLSSLREALEEVLGIHFQTDDADRLFFRSSLVQTMFYGLFSGWILWAETAPPEGQFDWRTAAYFIKVPFVEELFSEIVKPQRLRNLQVEDLMALAGSVLNRVDRPAFLEEFLEQDAITFFYEPFLASFDPELRDSLGVWYTPREIVKYQVARVDKVLKSELGIGDGLADPNVVILDPCAGTGSYLLECLAKIHETFEAKGEGGQAIVKTKQALLSRIIGFEILSAPFIVAHLQLGRFLAMHGAPLTNDEHPRIYLSNALTGWMIQKEELQTILDEIRGLYPGFERELVRSDQVKRTAPIMVILGNPPYNAYAGVGEEEEADLVEPYKKGLNTPKDQGGWGVMKFNLDDLYIRFYRLAERQIVESGRVINGVVTFISNYSWIEKPSFVVMREHMLRGFQQAWIDNLNGDKYKTGKRTPDGKPDESIFTTKLNREGIQVGTAISVLVRKPTEVEKPEVMYRELWGRSREKRKNLLENLNLTSKDFSKMYESIDPCRENEYILRPSEASEAFKSWPSLEELCVASPQNGLMEKRSFALIDIDRCALEQRMVAYYDENINNVEIAGMHEGLMKAASGFNPEMTRKKLLQTSKYQNDAIHEYAFKPMDYRWAYVETIPPLWNRTRPGLLAQAWRGNRFILSRPKGVRQPEGAPLYFSSTIGDNDLLNGHAYIVAIPSN